MARLPTHFASWSLDSVPTTSQKLLGDLLTSGCSPVLEPSLPELTQIYPSPSFLKLSSLVFHDNTLTIFAFLCALLFSLLLSPPVDMVFSTLLFPYKHAPLVNNTYLHSDRSANKYVCFKNSDSIWNQHFLKTVIIFETSTFDLSDITQWFSKSVWQPVN